MKGVIVAAGYGTRFLPVTKTLPKEMFPLINRPAIEFIVHELLESGINDILIITSRRKKVIEDYFEETSSKEGKFSNSLKDANIYFTRQKKMNGTGHAIYLAKSFVGDNPFVVAYPDDLFICKIPLAKQLIHNFEKTGKNVLSLVQIPKSEVYRYGIVDPDYDENKDTLFINKMIEKPSIEEAPSNYMSAGRYLFKQNFFEEIKELLVSWTYQKELTQTHAIERLIEKREVVGHIAEGNRLDIGQPLEYIKAFTLFALKYSDFANEYQNFLRELLKEN
ncbi:MAG: UTP--glucose-1-phosphate uridylyltransferase [Candidatus Hodarchaeales archaeon]